MNVAEFFINLGIKGNGKVKEGLSEVHTALKSARDTSWELKAGVVGAVIALEEMTRHAVGTAVDLKNFAGATGLSTEELQKWGYWAEINDVKAQGLAETIKGLQSAQAAMRLGIGVPAGVGYFRLNPGEGPVQMFAEVQKKLREIGNDQREIGNARTMAATLGITDDMFAALRIGTMGFAGLTKQMVLNRQEQQNLLALNRQWHEFWLTLRGTSNKSVANDLAGPITEYVHTLRNAIVELGEISAKFHSFLKTNFSPAELKVLQASFGALALAIIAFVAPLGPAIAAIAALGLGLDQIYKYTHGEKSLLGDVIEANKPFVGPMRPDTVGAGRIGPGSARFGTDYSPEAPGGPSHAARSFMDVVSSTLHAMRPGQSLTPTVSVVNHINADGHDPAKLAEHIDRHNARSVSNAVMQLQNVNASAVPTGSGGN